MTRTAAPHSPWPWRAVSSVVLLAIATALGMNWPWGVFFLVLTGTTLRSGETYLFDTVTREGHPGVFWMVNVFWILMGLALVALDLPLPEGWTTPGPP